mgnify:CR=1 FL=1
MAYRVTVNGNNIQSSVCEIIADTIADVSFGGGLLLGNFFSLQTRDWQGMADLSTVVRHVVSVSHVHECEPDQGCIFQYFFPAADARPERGDAAQEGEGGRI